MPHRCYAQLPGYVAPIYSFTDGVDGGEPTGGVVADGNGNLYGETYLGGTAACTLLQQPIKSGCGTVYRYSRDTGLTTLVSFNGTNGANGNNTLTLVGKTLYGTTTKGGLNDYGVVFSVHIDGTNFRLLHQFDGNDGSSPVGILRIGPNHLLYGVTKYGGNANAGVLFSLAPNGKFAILHQFAASKVDGGYPETLLIDRNTLFGGTLAGGGNITLCEEPGCGTVFEYNITTNSYRQIFTLGGYPWSGGYLGSIGPGPTIYGNGVNSLYSLSKATGATNIGFLNASFQGENASGPLLTPGGTLIGISGDSNPYSSGQLYSAQTTAYGAVTVLAIFTDSAGSNPLAQPIVINGRIIGTASLGGKCSKCGSIWVYRAYASQSRQRR